MKRYLKYIVIFFALSHSFARAEGANSSQTTSILMANAAMPYLNAESPVQKRIGEILLTGNMDSQGQVEMDASATFQKAFSPDSLQKLDEKGVDVKEFQRRVTKGDLSGAKDLLDDGKPADELTEEQEQAAQATARKIRSGILYRDSNESVYNDGDESEPEPSTEAPVEEREMPKRNAIPGVMAASIGNPSILGAMKQGAGVFGNLPVAQKMRSGIQKREVPQNGIEIDEARLREMGIWRLHGVNIFRLAHHKISHWSSDLEHTRKSKLARY